MTQPGLACMLCSHMQSPGCCSSYANAQQPGPELSKIEKLCLVGSWHELLLFKFQIQDSCEASMAGRRRTPSFAFVIASSPGGPVVLQSIEQCRGQHDSIQEFRQDACLT